MKLARVTFLGVRGLRDVTLDLTDPKTGQPRELVILAGASASGKTRALEALVAAKEAVAPYGPLLPGATWIEPGALAAKVAMSFWLDEEERTYAGVDSPTSEAEVTFGTQRNTRDAEEGLVAVLGRYQHGKRAGKLEYFPATRRLPSHGPFGGTSALEQRIQRTTKDARKYSFVPRFLRDLDVDAARGRRFGDALAQLSPTLRYEPTGGEGLPRCLRSRDGAAVTPLELSDGEADAVLLAATAIAIDLVSSLVLVDRPELYADPANFGAFVKGLGALGDDNQLVLASSSAELAAAAPDALIVRLEA
jgi:hypothetical protein